MPTAWRLVKTRHRLTAFTGDGARLFGGRWNHVGTPLVYTAGSLSLAALEILVNLDPSERMACFTAIPVTFNASLVTTLASETLPKNWRAMPAEDGTQALGTAWVAAGSSLVLEVPSAVIPEEPNYLINPAHPDFHRLAFGPTRPFLLDPRLI